MTAEKKTGSKQQPPWLRLVLDLERTMGRPREGFVRTHR
jgi:hypothetical protein